MILGIRPIVDFAFAKVFVSPQNKFILIAFLNAFFDLPDPIVDLVIENPINLKDFENDKLSILDIKATDSKGRIFNIEMQLSLHTGFLKRIVYYGTLLYSRQLTKGDDYDSLRPVYSIAIARNRLWADSKQVHHRFRLIDDLASRVMNDTIEFHTVELENYTLTEAELADASAADRWLYLLLYAQDYEPVRLKELFPELEFLAAIDTLIEISEKTEDRAMYDERENAIRDYNWIMKSARREGHEEGHKEGHKEGRIELIRTLQLLANRTPITDDEAAPMNDDAIAQMIEELKSCLRNRGAV
jgi:predicted transposase/invertase (TIGR01784 family)